jgi:hypothetical protein
MKRMMLLGLFVLLVGCEYIVSLVTTPEIDIDKSIIGLWQRSQEDGQTERLLVLPLGKKEYLVSFTAGSDDAMFGRACLCRVSGKMLFQIEWLGTAKAELPKDNRVFQFGNYSLAGDTLTLHLLNSDLISKDISSSADLAKAIAGNIKNPKLLREGMVFRKVKN